MKRAGIVLAADTAPPVDAAERGRVLSWRQTRPRRSMPRRLGRGRGERVWYWFVCLGVGERVGGGDAGGGVDDSMVGMLVTDQVPPPRAQADASDQQPGGEGGGVSGLGSALLHAMVGAYTGHGQGRKGGLGPAEDIRYKGTRRLGSAEDCRYGEGLDVTRMC